MECETQDNMQSYVYGYEIQRPERESWSWRLSDSCALYIAVWAVTPWFNSGMIYRCIVILAVLYFALTELLHNGSRQLGIYCMCCLLLIGLQFFDTGILGQNIVSGLSQTFNIAVYCLLGIISYHYYEYDKRKFIVLSISVLVIYAVTAVPSLIALRTNRWVMRNASGKTERTGIEKYAGSYGYSFGLLFLVTILLYDLRNEKRDTAIRVIEMGLVLLSGYIVLNAGYTTAVVLLTVGVFSALLFPKKNYAVASIITLCLGLLLMYVLPIVLDAIITHYEISDVYRSKINYISSVLNSSGDVTYADSTRGRMLYESIDILWKYPVLGSLLCTGRMETTGHAVLIDVLGNHGLFYFVLYFYVIVLLPWRLMKGNRTLQIVYLLLVVLLGITDTFDYATMAVPYFIGPLVANDLDMLRGDAT